MSSTANGAASVRWPLLTASVFVPLLIQLAAIPLHNSVGVPAIPYELPIVLAVGLVLLVAAFRGRVIPTVLATAIWVPGMYFLSIMWSFGIVAWLYGGP